MEILFKVVNLEGIKLTTHYPYRNYRCDRCDIPLKCSVWKNTNIVFSTNNTPRKGFVCVQCATRKRPYHAKPRTTMTELDEFIANLKKKPAELVVITT